MQTVPPSRSTPRLGKLRRQLTRCERTTPFGAPVLPLVKKMTCGIALVERGFVDVAVREAGEIRGRDARQIRARDALRARGVGDDERGQRVVEDVGRFVRAEPPVHRREHRAELRQADEELHDGKAGLAPPGDAVAMPDAEVAQRVRSAVGRRVELRERDLVVVERRGECVRCHLRRVPQDVPDEESAAHAGSGGAP